MRWWWLHVICLEDVQGRSSNPIDELRHRLMHRAVYKTMHRSMP
ncbi:hypothetical protein RRSWK_04261 [Rhodopirellula sp. SWK7]|nr:hypothetical protein RRSWK_04261 [Rhodopirellula sp. SWK7]